MEIITTAELQKRLKVSRTTVWKWSKNGVIPPPIELGERALRWDWEAILAALKARKPGKRGRPAKNKKIQGSEGPNGAD